VSTQIPVAAWSKAWVYGRSLAGIAGSNPSADTDIYIYLVRVVCQRRSQWPRGLRLGSTASRWDCGFESLRGHGYIYIYLVRVVC